VSAPDLRYLVDVSLLPLIPRGAWCWWDHYSGMLPCIYHNARTNPPFVLEDGQSLWFDRGALHLDLSPPDVVGGFPVRLDALGWALAVLARWYDIYIGGVNDIVAMSGHDERTLWSAWSPGSAARLLAHGEDGWEEFDHADPLQKRRIVAAILRKGRPGVAS